MVTIESRQATADRIFKQCKDLLVSKGKAYNPGTTDANRNFKKIGEMLGIDPRVVWCVYFLKQVDAFVSIMLGGSDGGEPLESRAVDICNYAVIGVDVDSEPKTFVPDETVKCLPDRDWRTHESDSEMRLVSVKGLSGFEAT